MSIIQVKKGLVDVKTLLAVNKAHKSIIDYLNVTIIMSIVGDSIIFSSSLVIFFKTMGNTLEFLPAILHVKIFNTRHLEFSACMLHIHLHYIF